MIIDTHENLFHSCVIAKPFQVFLLLLQVQERLRDTRQTCSLPPPTNTCCSVQMASRLRSDRTNYESQVLRQDAAASFLTHDTHLLAAGAGIKRERRQQMRNEQELLVSAVIFIHKDVKEQDRGGPSHSLCFIQSQTNFGPCLRPVFWVRTPSCVQLVFEGL